MTVFYTGCNFPEQASIVTEKMSFTADTNVRYSKRFVAGNLKNENGIYRTIYIYGDKKNNNYTSVLILYPKSVKKPELIKDAFYIATPVERVACLGTVYTTMLQKLGLLDKILAVENAEYYNNPFVIQGAATGKLKELHKGPEINVEQTIRLKPGLILTFGMGNPKKDMNEKILNAGIPAAISLDHLEETPLARAEWIKFVSMFFGKEKMADSLFRITEQNYKNLETLTDTLKRRPTVFTDIKYGDAWYVPGGDSYMANLISDAGGDYIWKDEKKTGSIPLNFETVYSKAKEADFWINLFMVKTKKELLGYEKRYELFKAFRTENIYNNNKTANKNGYSIYWEEGMCSPDEVLKDLIKIFHPYLLPNHNLKYYKKLE